MKRFALIALALAFTLAAAIPAGAHCQIPCGIYDDPALMGQDEGLEVVNRTYQSWELFGQSGPRASDIKQGQAHDCYFLSMLASVVGTDPRLIRDNIRSSVSARQATRN